MTSAPRDSDAPDAPGAGDLSARDPGPGAPDDERALARLGWDARWQAARAAADPTGDWQPVRIAAEHRGAYHALGPGGLAWVELTGRAFHAADDKRDLPVVGDWVLVERWPDAVAGTSAAVVRVTLPRKSFLVRRAAGAATAPQPLVANVDAGIVMSSANADLSPARLDRYIAALRDGGIAPALVLSKIDLVADPTPLIAELAAIVDRVIAVSVVTGQGLDQVRALGGPGTTCVLLGSSGVGKSSLLNAIAGTAQPTRAIRADDRGRHTTTRRELFVAGGPDNPDGPLWIDTPGMRELGQWLDDDEHDADELAFDDIADLSQRCRFRNCGHLDEPGCAVRDQVSPSRLASFHKLADERRSSTARQAQARKLAETRKAKIRKPPPSSDD